MREDFQSLGRNKTTPEPAPLVSSSFDFPYSRSKNGGTADLTVKKIQTRLNELGYKTVEPDGYLGPITESAIQQYQRESRVPITGEVDAAMYRLLFPDEIIPDEHSVSRKGAAEFQTPAPTELPAPSFQPTLNASSSSAPTPSPETSDSFTNDDSADLEESRGKELLQ